MSDVPGASKPAGDLSSSQEITQAALEDDTRPLHSEKTSPLEAPEATLPLSGMVPVETGLEATLAFSPSQLPPGSLVTLDDSQQETVFVDSKIQRIRPIADPSERLAATELAPPHDNGDPEVTIDTHQANRTTEFVDQTSLPVGQPKASKPAAIRGAPSVTGYKLLAEIGRGGMGVVYKAWHERLDRPVALKMIIAGAHASSEQLERFQIEAQAVARIQDPGIVQIYDVGEHDGLPYFSLEFVEGGSLDKKIGGRPQPAREAATMVRKLALAMAKAHQRKIIHRDLKPANVLLTLEGEPKITDFGLAKRMEADSHQTRSGAIMGTPSYMAPEQAWGQTREIGTHTDQYALGTILYEMLVGHVPFQGATALETLELARTQEPVPPRRLQPRIPVDLETICLKCLQKEASRRYADVSVLADELGRYLDGQPIQARPIGRFERSIRWCRRNPRVAALVATVAVLLITVAIVSTASAVRFKTLNTTLENSIASETAAKKVAEEKESLAVTAKIEAEKSRQIAEEARKKEAAQLELARAELERSRKAIRAAIAQNRNALEVPRLMSVLINQRLAPLENTREIREELIKTALKHLQIYVETMDQLSGVFDDKEGALMVKRTLAGINQRAGKIAEEYERYDEAVRYYTDMNKEADALEAMSSGDLVSKKIQAIARGTLGGFQLDRVGDAKAALALFQQTLKMRREILALTPQDDGAKGDVCMALGAIARSDLKLGNPEKARDSLREEVKLRDQFSPAYAAKVEVRRERAGLEEKIGDLCLDLNDFEAARASYDLSLRQRQGIVDDYPEENQARRDVMLSTQKIATLNLFEHKPEEALKGYQQVLDAARQRLKAYGENNVAKPDLWVLQDISMSEYGVATAHLRLKQIGAAKEHYRACLEIRQSLSSDPRFKLNTIDLMIARARCGLHVEASKAARQLVESPASDSRVYYFAACGFSLCVGDLAELPVSPENQALAGQYTEGALKALRLARKAGWNNRGDLRNDPDLDPIRDDPGFKSLVKELTEPTAP